MNCIVFVVLNSLLKQLNVVNVSTLFVTDVRAKMKTNASKNAVIIIPILDKFTFFTRNHLQISVLTVLICVMKSLVTRTWSDTSLWNVYRRFTSAQIMAVKFGLIMISNQIMRKNVNSMK